MSYLGPLRLHFYGSFQADPSTVNNSPRNFDPTVNPKRGSWNPRGSASFRLKACTVTMVSYKDGTTSTSDPVVGLSLTDANARVAGKLVDLDSEQQMVSEVWGLIVRLTDGVNDLVGGSFTVAPFSDIWFGRGGSGDGGAGSFYQSTIEPLRWGDDHGSRFLQELKNESPDALSIKFNVDSYNGDSTSASFTFGRIVGTIGPAAADEPRHFVLGRQLFSPVPVTTMNFAQATVDRGTRRIYADFGNSLPTANGGLANIGALNLGYLDASNAFHSIGGVNYQGSGWYTTTAAVAVIPDRDLTDAELQTLETSRLAVAGSDNTPILQENFDGLYVRADQFVYRLDPGDPANVTLYATQYGQRAPNTAIVATRDTSGFSRQGGPKVGDPPDKIDFPKRITTGTDGTATLTIDTKDPGVPRDYIDGQIYGVRYYSEAVWKQLQKPNPPFGYNPSDFVSILLWSGYPIPDEPTWYGNIQPIFAQYASLYPIMDALIDLSDYEAVARNAHVLAFAFGLPSEDPNTMPVTRDLSDAKRQTILKWLTTPGADGKPLLGTPPAEAALAAAEPEAKVAVEATGPEDSKTIAHHNRGTFEVPEEL